MGGHGYLAISERDTSVMLIDCARMASDWTLERARRERRKAIERGARCISGGRSTANGTRATESTCAGSRRCCTSPRSTRSRGSRSRSVRLSSTIRSARSGTSSSAGANQAGFQIFGVGEAERGCASRWRGSRRRRPQRIGRAAGGERGARPRPARTPCSRLSLGNASHAERPVRRRNVDGRPRRCGIRRCRRWRRRRARHSTRSCVIDALDACRRGCGLVRGRAVPPRAAHGRGDRRRRSASRFAADGSRFRAAAARRVLLAGALRGCRRCVAAPALAARIAHAAARSGARELWLRDGGRAATARRACGCWRMTRRAHDAIDRLRRSARLAVRAQVAALHAAEPTVEPPARRTRLGLDPSWLAQLAPPWPDLVIATGRHTAPVARWIGAAESRRSRLVQLGRKGGDVADRFDLAVTCAHFRLPPHPRRVETLVPSAPSAPRRSPRRPAPAGSLARRAATAGGVAGGRALRRVIGSMRSRRGASGRGGARSRAAPAARCSRSPVRAPGAEATEALAEASGDGAFCTAGAGRARRTRTTLCCARAT